MSGGNKSTMILRLFLAFIALVQDGTEAKVVLKETSELPCLTTFREKTQEYEGLRKNSPTTKEFLDSL